ncbi:hypothetical protein Verru16b_02277 [Lacunisphaera limnophila]|uniref:Glutathionylspermidine synthase n=1 Tax=Lacunisphaera limnophila TaxID=1838286 RepID=A0A1D8AWD8_9BACT|nr:hypothetical protein [Lacunisphaera limnophila]AOS45199.1 hypothetical protein Verru16b_02277 [Lacunisphaera limnophila]
MSDLTHEQIKTALSGQPLFEDKTWQLSPAAWPLTPEQVRELEQIGAACLEFHQALETLYLRAVAGKNLLRNKPLLAPWVADYLDRGKPADLVAHARDPKNRGALPTVLRPDLLLTDEGFALTELDSVPGGIGLTAFLNRLYGGADDPAVLGHGDAMVENFHQSLAGLRPDLRNPLIAILVSDEAATYRPEMQWLAEQQQRLGRRVFCMRPEDVFPLGGDLCFDVEGTPEKIDVIYRFYELFDWPNVRIGREILEAWQSGAVALAPPMRPFQEEKLALALFHHHLLRDFWAETLSGRARQLLQKLIPRSWIMDPAPLPPGAVLDGPVIGGRLPNDWRELAAASQKERDLIIKISGFHPTAWGARSVVLGSDCSREEWQAGIEQALSLASTNLHLLQEYRKPKRIMHPLYEAAGAGPAAAVPKAGRLRLCPYYFVVGGQPRLSGALATFCPPDKKIIHGMTDAALLPCRVFPLN